MYNTKGPYSKYKLLILDMDGTIYRFKEGGGQGAVYKTEFYNEVKERGIELIVRKLTLSKKDANRVWEQLFKEYNGDISIGLEKEFNIFKKEYFDNAWKIDARKYIDADSGLRGLLLSLDTDIALLTAAPKVWASSVIERLGLRGVFRDCWYGDGEIRKPDKRAYTQVLQRFGVDPKLSLAVDDEPRCLEVAKKLGIGTALVDEKKEQDSPFIDYVVGDIYETKNVLRR